MERKITSSLSIDDSEIEMQAYGKSRDEAEREVDGYLN